MKLKKTKRPRKANRLADDLYKKNPVYTYRSSRKEIERPFNRSDSKDEKTNSFASIVQAAARYLVLAVVFGALFYVQSLGTDAVINVKGNNVMLREENEYIASINNHLKSTVLNRSKFLIDKDSIARNIQDSFAEIEKVEISTTLLSRRPIVEISYAKPEARLLTQNENYILDREGRAISLEKNGGAASNHDGAILIQDNTSHIITLGKPALTLQQMDYIREVIGQSKAKQMDIEAMFLSRGGAGLDVKYKDTGYLVKFSFAADPRQSSGAYFAIRDQFAGNTKPAQYIDIRIPDRAYVN